MCKTLLAIGAMAFVGSLAAEPWVNQKGISYARSDLPASGRHVLDVRCPAGVTNFPTLVWFHGGGLVNGNAHFLPIWDKTIAQIAPNYRYLDAANHVTGADCIRDAAAAVVWTLENIASYGGDPKRVFVGGMSAGGYLTLMVGLDNGYLAAFGHSTKELAGLIPVSGQATVHFNVRKFSGDTEPQFLPQLGDLAPLRHLAKDAPPILDICGEPPYEWKGRAEENRFLIGSLRALGHPAAWYVELPYCTHGMVLSASPGYIQMFIRGDFQRTAAYTTK